MSFQRKVHDNFSLAEEERVRQDQESSRTFFCYVRERRIELGRIARLEKLQANAQRPCHCVALPHEDFRDRMSRIQQSGEPGDPENSFFQQLNPLSAEAFSHRECCYRHVTARAGETFYEVVLERISYCGKDHRNVEF